ncbi:MAG: hypothetical protein ABI402_17225 [Ferruginibacter sp.]
MKTTNYYFLFILISTNLLFSCKQPNNNEAKLYKSMENGFLDANAMIKNETDKIYWSSKSKLQDPSYAEKMQEWMPKIDSIRSASSVMINYIDQIKFTLVKKAGIKVNDTTTNYNADNIHVISEILTEGEMKDLNEKINNYKSKIIAVDSFFINWFPDNIAVKNIIKITKTTNEDLHYTKNISGASALLTKLQNNIYIIENGFVENCYSHVGMLDGNDFVDKNSILVGQTANILKGGTALTISAGVGEFSSTSNAKFTFGNQKIKTSNDGQTSYTFKVPKKPGHYSIPVSVNFIDKRNKSQEMKVNVEYEVSVLQ